MNKVISIFKTKHYEILAKPMEDGTTVVGIYPLDRSIERKFDSYYWTFRRWGSLNPKPKTWRRVWFGKESDYTSIGDTIRIVIEKAQSMESALREGEIKIAEATTLIQELANIENELIASTMTPSEEMV